MSELQDNLTEILRQKNTYLLPTNIRSGVTILGVTGTLEDADTLTNTVTNLENQVTELTTALENKTAGAVIKPNIYVQQSEPTKKDGIWLQTNKTAEHYISDGNIFFGGTWSLESDTAPIPYEFYRGSAVAIGTDIYLLGGDSSRTTAYKYNTLTDTYTQLTDIPYNFFSSSAVAIGTDIYLLGSSYYNNNTTAYKYNTLTDTYTQLTSTPYKFLGGSAVAIGTDIYLLGGDGNNTRAYKYNTLTDTYTQLTNIPYQFYRGSAVAIGTDIYLLGTMNSSTTAYKYNTLTDTYTQLTDIPYNFYSSSAVAIGTDIYLLGGSGNNRNYKYNTLTDTYTQLTNIPYQFSEGAAVAIGTDIYLLGGYSTRTNTRIYHLENKSYATDNSVIIAQGRTYDVSYNVKLFETNFESAYQPLYGFADAWFYTTQDGLIKNIPTYYGNGTSWVKFKN